jgi:hypothetical protein
MRLIERASTRKGRSCLLCSHQQETVATFRVDGRVIVAGLCAVHHTRLRSAAA